MERPDVQEGLRRLLGAEGPDIDCDVCFAEIDRYVELELAGGDADQAVPAMRTHLESCPSCRQQYETLRSFLLGRPAFP